MSQDLYDEDQHLLFRTLVCHYFVTQVKEGRLFYAEGQVSDWMKKMSKNGSFVDHYWLTACSKMLGHDIVLLPTFTQSSTEIGKIIRIQGGWADHSTSSCVENSGLYPPIFLGYMEDNLYSSGHFQDIVPKDEGIDIIQYLQHGFVRRTNIQTQFPTLSLSRHIPLTNMPLPIVDRVSFNNVDSSILAGQSVVRQRILSEIPGSSPVHNSTKRAREE